jgi:hypothetical protein
LTGYFTNLRGDVDPQTGSDKGTMSW